MVQKLPNNGDEKSTATTKTADDKPTIESKTTPLSDKADLRRRAKEHVEKGAVTDAYQGDRTKVIELLQNALATEIVCWMRYKRHAYMADGLSSESIKTEFEEHAREEREHADMIATRIVQLGGEPNLDPKGLLERSHSEYTAGSDVVSMMKADLIEERVAIESYSEIIRFIGEKDSTTRRMLEEILAKEEEHAEDLSSLLKKHLPDSK